MRVAKRNCWNCDIQLPPPSQVFSVAHLLPLTRVNASIPRPPRDSDASWEAHLDNKTIHLARDYFFNFPHAAAIIMAMGSPYLK